MCGRFALKIQGSELGKRATELGFHIDHVEVSDKVKPRLNIAPHSYCWVLRPKKAANDNSGGTETPSEICVMKWSLQPANVSEPLKFATFNTRIESLDPLKPTWRCARKNRCVVFMQGYYEWQVQTKQPYYVHSPQPSAAVMCCLAIWDTPGDVDAASIISTTASPSGIQGNTITPTFSIVTMPAPTEEMQALHHRMPIIVSPEIAQKWIFGSWEEALTLVKSLDKASLMPLTYHRVGSAIGSVKIENPNLIKKVSEKKITDFFKRKQPTTTGINNQSENSSKKIKK